MKHRRKLRRGAILALVLVMLCNAIPARANTTQEPTVIVNTYGALQEALENAEAGDVIGVQGVIKIPTTAYLDYIGVTIRRMSYSARLMFENDGGTIGVVKNICFDGNSTEVGGTMPFIVLATGSVNFSFCTFEDCIDEGGNGGAIYIGSGDTTISYCTFRGNSAYYGSHIYSGSDGVLKIDNCSFMDGWADEAGGAIYLSSPCTTYIQNTRITDNHTRTGGGIYNAGYLNLENTAVYLNEGTVHGADIVSEGTLVDSTTEAQYSSWLDDDGLYYVGWVEDIDPTVGGAGDYLKMEVSDEDPNAVEPTPTPDPTPTPPSEEDTGEDIVDPIIPPNEEENDQEIQDPNEGSDQEETPPNVEENEGESSGEEETPPASEEKDPEEGDIGSTEEQEPNTGEQIGGDTNITNNIDNTQIDSSGSGNSSVTNNSVSNGDTVTNSSQNIDNSSSVVSGDTVTNSSQNSDSSVHNSSTDNSSYNEDHSYRDNSSSTVNNYYQQEATGGSQNGSQPVNVTVPVNVTIPEQKEPATGSTQAPEQAVTVPQDIKIEAEGVDLVYEYTENGVSISIKATKEPESLTPTVTPVSTPVMATEQAESPQGSPNWVEVVTMILLAILVLGELRDKWKSKA